MTEPRGGGVRQRAAQAAAERKADTADNPGTAVVVPGNVAYQMLAGWKPQLSQALARGQDPENFLRMAATLMANSKQAGKLAQCTRPSLYTALMQSAHYGLMPFTDEAAIVPYGDVATFVPQYQGFVKLAFNTGQVRSVTAKLIYRRDLWDVELGPQGRGFIHKPLLFDDDYQPVLRGRLDAGFQVVPGPGDDNPPVLAYCYATFRDGASTEVEIITMQEAIETRDKYSKSYRSAETSYYGKPPKRDSFWHTDPEKAWLKTAVRRAMKYIPKSPELLELILADNAADSNIPGQAQPWQPPALEAFTPGGPAAAWEGDVNHGDGSVVAGEVMPPDSPPEPPGAPTGTDAGSAGSMGGKDAPDRQQDDMARIRDLFGQAKWGGQSQQAVTVRRMVLADLARVDQARDPLVRAGKLDAGQAAMVVERLSAIVAGEDPYARLAQIAREAQATRDTEAGNPPPPDAPAGA